MTFIRLSLCCAAVLSMGSCRVSTVPEPPEFKLSAEALSKEYSTWQGTPAGPLYAGKILITRDEAGHKTYLASGGALLTTQSEPAIQAQAPSIRVTAEFAEVHGRAMVKKGERLYIGEDESTTFRIQGTEITPEGPHIIRGTAGAEGAARSGTGSAETVDISLALTPTFAAARAAAPAPELPSEPVKVKPEGAAKPKATSRPPTKQKPALVKASGPPVPPAPKVKAAPAVDRTRLLDLMREPTER